MSVRRLAAAFLLAGSVVWADGIVIDSLDFSLDSDGVTDATVSIDHPGGGLVTRMTIGPNSGVSVAGFISTPIFALGHLEPNGLYRHVLSPRGLAADSVPVASRKNLPEIFPCLI